MLSRIKQVFSALTARVDAADRAFVSGRLNEREQGLFFSMNLPDQRHALNVAYTAAKLAASHRPEVDGELLARCALLHDVGKVKGDVSTWDKIITVAAHYVAPGWARRWGKQGRGGAVANLRHAFYTYYHHPERGVALLAAVGTQERVLEIIRRHHEMPEVGEPLELTILRDADDLN